MERLFVSLRSGVGLQLGRKADLLLPHHGKEYVVDGQQEGWSYLPFSFFSAVQLVKLLYLGLLAEILGHLLDNSKLSQFVGNPGSFFLELPSVIPSYLLLYDFNLLAIWQGNEVAWDKPTCLSCGLTTLRRSAFSNCDSASVQNLGLQPQSNWLSERFKFRWDDESQLKQQ